MYNIASFHDKEDIKALWAYAFDEQEPFLSGFFDEFWKAENAVIIKENNQLVAALLLMPYEISVRSKIIKSSYIVGVSVCPEKRGKGYSKTLMKSALLEQRKRKEPLSLLIPFSYEFYRKFGYSLCYTLNVHETDSSNIRSFSKHYSMKKMTADDIEKLNEAYRKYANDKNGYVLRSEDDWKYIFFEHSTSCGYIYGAFDKNELKGYISYTKQRDKLRVRELVYNDKTALDTLISFATSHFSNKAEIIIRTAQCDGLDAVIKEPKDVLKLMPTVMARITDVCAILSYFDIGNLRIKVIDDFIAENDGIFYQREEVIKEMSGDFDAEIDISALTQLVMGFKSAKELVFSNELKADEKTVKELDEIFPKTVNYINHIMEA